jgi:hypothetical protein
MRRISRKTLPLAKPTDSQDAMPQGKSNPNASGAVAPRGCYQVYVSGRFDDDSGGVGEGQITTNSNDGYPYPDGAILKRKGSL